MLSSVKLPRGFWGEALNSACYLVNSSPSHVLESDILQSV